MDSTDEKILSELQKDARISYTNLAKKLDMSDVAVKKRVDKLVDDGIIKNFSIELDHKKLGKNVRAIIFLRVLPENSEHIATALRKMDNIVKISPLLGQYDFSLEAVCKDLDELKKITEEKISPLKGVNEIRVHIVV